MGDITMVLANNTEITISEVNFPLHIVVERETRNDIHGLWNSFTPENLAHVEFRENGDRLFSFLNCTVRGEQIVVNADGSITGHYYFDGEREIVADSEYETAGRILLGEEE